MRNLLLPILLLSYFAVSAQDSIQVNYITINPSGLNVTINWKTPPNPVDGYIICRYAKTPQHGLDSLFSVGNTTNCMFQFGAVDTVAVRFAVLGFRKDASGKIIYRSPYKRPIHRTMFATLAYDSCSSKINMTWTHYIGWGTDLKGYLIFDDNTGLQVASVAASDSTYTFSNINANRLYKYHVRAIHKNGTYVSNSNYATIFTETMNPPAFINVRNVEVQNSSGQITFYIDPVSQLYNYRLIGSERPDGGFQIVNEYTTYTSNILTATIQSLGASTMYYKLQSINNCNEVSMSSSLATVIAPKFAISGQEINLTWDAYLERPYGIREYRMLRSIGNEPAVQLGTTPNTSYRDDLSVLSGQQLSGNICYFIESVANPDGTGNIYKATSKTVCIDVASQIFIPQAFTPNGDGQNDEFKPSFAFLPADYTMIIYNRYGSKIFETNVISKGWNGVIKNGVKAPEGSYIYFISFTTSSGSRIEKKGSLTLIYP